MTKHIKNVSVLVSICMIVAVLLSVTNYFTAPIIQRNDDQKANEALYQVLPDGGSFEKIDLTQYTLPATVVEAYRASEGGYAIKLSTAGYASGLVIMCGINADGTVSGAVCLGSNETWGLEKTFGEKLVGSNADTVVDVEAGATSKTINGYRAAVKDALNAAKIFGGESVEIRTEEEILRDNLNEALPAANGEFDKTFFTEAVEGVDAIYTAKNGAGAVYVIGEKLIVADANGVATGDCTAEEAAVILAAYETLAASTLTDVDLAAYTGISSSVTSVKKTTGGSYVIEVKANGYSTQNPYAPAETKLPIIIQVSITADGVIIDTLTLSQNESANYGAACAEESFYGQFDGKTEANYGEIDAIVGATVTTNAYKTAILNAFKAVTIIEEVTE